MIVARGTETVGSPVHCLQTLRPYQPRLLIHCPLEPLMLLEAPWPFPTLSLPPLLRPPLLLLRQHPPTPQAGAEYMWSNTKRTKKIQIPHTTTRLMLQFLMRRRRLLAILARCQPLTINQSMSQA